ncbi:hypothetical protein P879_01180 [Paragonimus westermani]|uniref:Myb-like domain-containing protein n=1 Tax=Paragonimus westermani TaxID=34504 RepID=A0A8T0DY47_9TREM|nr:hypothetical protein P879_01180 [Paragonimus westermani]
MKTRSAPTEAPNIAAIVKARHHARVLCPITEHSGCLTVYGTVDIGDVPCPSSVSTTVLTGSNLVSAGIEDTKAPTEEKQKIRTDGAPKLLRAVAWSPDDRRLFFQAVRIYGRNFTEITRFIRSRGHRISLDTVTVSPAPAIDPSIPTGPAVFPNMSFLATSSNSSVPATGILTNVSSGQLSGTVTSNAFGSLADLNAPCGGRTREQVRFFYQQTWHKVRRYIKFPESVPQHVREVYALINYSVIRTRIKKPLDHRLGEKLNELVHCGTTVIRHNGRRFLLRTPVCQALKQLNHITAPPQEFLLPEDVWVELVPATQADLWRVLEAEQNPRLRLRVDINRQLSDLIKLVETKWQLAADRMRTLFELPLVRRCPIPRLLVRTLPNQTIDGAVRLQEVARVRSCDMALRAYLQRQSLSKDVRKLNPTTLTGPSSVPSQQPVTYDMNSSPPHQALVVTEQSPRASGGPCDGVEGNVFMCPTQPPTTVSTASGAPPVSMITTSATAELDLREIGRQLVQGVTCEGARAIKVLTLFLALGCPDRVQLEYSFVPDTGVNATQPSGPSSSSCFPDLLYWQPTDPEGHGIGNGLRRLLHLNASDYLLHRDWLSVQPSLTSPPAISIATVSSSPSVIPTPPYTPASHVAITSVETIGDATALSTIYQPSTQPTQLPIVTNGNFLVPRVISTVTTSFPTILPYPTNTSTLQSLPPTVGPPCISTIALSTPSSTTTTVLSHSVVLVSTPSSTKTTTSNRSPNVIAIPKPVGSRSQMTIVERQLDHQRAPGTPERPRLPLATPTIGPKVPISKIPSLVPRTEPTPLVHTPKQPVSIMPRTSSTTTSSISNTPEFRAPTSDGKLSSLHTMKAHNRRRRTSSTLGRGGRVPNKPALLRCPFPSVSPVTGRVPVLLAPKSIPSITVQPTVTNIMSSQNHLWPITTSVLHHPVVTSAIISTTSNTVVPADSSELSLGTLFDPLATNQSSMSALSNDTLASLLNTIGQPSSVTTDASQGPFRDTVDRLPGLPPVTILSNPVNLDQSDMLGPLDEHAPLPQLESGHHASSYKCEESVPSSFDWSEFSHFHRPCPASASTPHLPSESPAFGDISLTDSMAAAVMDTHRGDLDPPDLDQSLSELHQESTTPVVHPVPPPVSYVTSMEAFLRMIVAPSSSTIQTDSGTVDLNSLLQSVVVSSTGALTGLPSQPD